MSNDRRVEYSRAAIKNAFLKLLSTRHYNEITITDLCKESNVSRGTFYAQYERLGNVLNDVLSDAFSMMSVTTVLEQCDSRKLSLCRMIRENDKYRALFMDDDLTDYIAEQMISYFRPSYISSAAGNSGLSEEAAAAFLEFQVQGCYAIARKNAGKSEEEWQEIRNHIDDWIYKGFQKHC
ncbi:MAG: TetR/AcrR family transcriptional regulator [Bulleidia sp.]|nr:TetR/AcrR family transcriptional regulator [Bulleidia sp.]